MRLSTGSTLVAFITLVGVLLSTPLAAGSAVDVAAPRLPWLSNLNADDRVTGIRTIRTRAEVAVSDGLTYSVDTVFHDPQRAVFHRIYTDRTVTQGIDGRYVWEFDGATEKEAGPVVESFVLGHQFHAQLLFFDRLNEVAAAPRDARFAGRDCRALDGDREGSAWTIFFEAAGRPLGMTLVPPGGEAITFGLGDWRDVDGIDLPFAVSIDDGERQFEYRYRSVKMNEGSMAGLRAPEDVLTEEQKLLRLHRVIMDAHLFGEAAPWQALQHDSLTIVSAGEVLTPSKVEAEAAVERILSSRKHARYDDLIRPVVRVSNDGTLGWVIVQVAADGVRLDADGNTTEPLAFVSGWIELYEKIDGRWRLTGNVSNFRPEEN